MALLELFIESVSQNPVFRHSCLLGEGVPERVIGRDGACDVCLPNTDKTISRRHLAVWNQSGNLWFRVLSSVNGVDLPGGEVPPGARALLPLDQILILGGYRLYVTVVAERGAGEDATLVEPVETQHRVAPTVPAMSRSQPVHLSTTQVAAADHDPFADWAFQTDAAGKPLALEPSNMELSPDLKVFFKAVGLDASRIGSLTTDEIDTLGRVVRLGLEALLNFEYKRENENSAETHQAQGLLPQQSNNPLHNQWTVENKLRYLLGGRAASVGFVKPALALQELIADIQIHQQASLIAAKAADDDAGAALERYSQEVQRLKAGCNMLRDE